MNYTAVFEMVTEVALEGGIVRSYMTYDWFDGMDNDTYKILKSDINELKSIYAYYYPSGTADTAENRKYFLYGCGIHAAQDAFSHSTATQNGNEIKHKPDDWEHNADNPKHYGRRIKVANRMTQIALLNLANYEFSDGEAMLQALKDEYQTAIWKMFNVKKYINANGYNGAILSTVTIDK